MTEDSSNRRAGFGPLAASALVLACVVLVSVWGVRRASEGRTLDEALAPYAAAPLPSPGEAVDGGLADLGAQVFRNRCAACHAVSGEEKLGPNLAGITERRSAAWIRTMILRPDSMTDHDPVARELKERYGVQMLVPGGAEPQHARAVLEFLRRADAGGGADGSGR